MSIQAKDAGRELVMRGGPWSGDERQNILAYCEEDVLALERLFLAMVPKILETSTLPGVALSQALWRGRYGAAVARMERVGIPMDMEILGPLRAHFDAIKEGLIREIDRQYGVYVEGRFVAARFEAYLEREGIPWPRLPSGQLALDEDTFRAQARSYPKISALRELRHTLSSMRLHELAVGQNGRNRCLLSPYRSKTGRNQPSNSKFVFGASVWLRGLIKPAEGYGIAYIDFISQELGIAAALSRDAALGDSYRSGDPYIDFAIRAGLAPAAATKHSHTEVRNRCKALVLGLQYGMTEYGLAKRLGISIAEAQHLHQLHKQSYPEFWRWSDQQVDRALFGFPLSTALGWTLRAGPYPNPRSLRNFPMQAHGAEILRMACILATEAGIRICAPVHDAILIEARLDELEDQICHMRELMAQASRVILSGFELATSYEQVAYPKRFMDEARGRTMWDEVMRSLSAYANLEFALA